jgi:hypothetical protein
LALHFLPHEAFSYSQNKKTIIAHDLNSIEQTMPLHSIISSLRRSRRDAPSLQANTETLRWRLLEIFMRMWDLGFTSFGGPPVHFQILHRRFVEGVGVQGGSKWLDYQTVSSIRV